MNVNEKRWRRSYPGRFGFISGKWEKVEASHPFLNTDGMKYHETSPAFYIYGNLLDVG